MVGEAGPELEVTAPSRIYSNSQTRDMMSNPELTQEIKELRRELSDSKAEQRAASVAMVKYNKRTSDQLRTWNSVGLPQERTN
jgi:TPP-dependent trihydroxycyclohexane-1,2-dione (THcHDO) dehydratase